MSLRIDGYQIGRDIEPDHPRCTTSDHVWEATNSRGERVVVKVLSLHFPLRGESAAKFLVAMNQARAIVSPHVMKVVDAGFAEHRAPFYAMEFVDGETVASAIERGVIATVEQTRTIVEQIAEAASAATRAGCVAHLHTRHIMLTATGARLWDFGVWPWRRWAHELVAGTYTNGGQVTWHPNLTPSEAKGLPPLPSNAAAQLALIAFSMLTAKHFWHADNDPDSSPMNLLVEATRGMGEPPSARTQIALPVGFDAWFTRCLDGGYADAAAAASEFPR